MSAEKEATGQYVSVEAMDLVRNFARIIDNQEVLFAHAAVIALAIDALIAARVKEAVEVEREACADLVEMTVHGMVPGTFTIRLAANIRARPDAGGKPDA